jgi:hypothetical protein
MFPTKLHSRGESTCRARNASPALSHDTPIQSCPSRRTGVCCSLVRPVFEKEPSCGSQPPIGLSVNGRSRSNSGLSRSELAKMAADCFDDGLFEGAIDSGANVRYPRVNRKRRSRECLASFHARRQTRDTSNSLRRFVGIAMAPLDSRVRKAPRVPVPNGPKRSDSLVDNSVGSND